MQVVKRSGISEPVFFDKITIRLNKLINDGNIKNVDSTLIAQKVIRNLYNGITTQELDELSSRICASLISDEPNYGLLASRICVSNLHKSTPDNFYEGCKMLMNNKDVNGVKVSLLSEDVFNIIEKNKDLINSKIVHERDYLIDFFGFKTLQKAYLMKSNNKIIERPQYLWMRVAIGIHKDDLESVFQTYDLMSQKKMTHATPTLFNSATNKPQLSSCFLMGTEDSVTGIFKTISSCAQISKNSGGIGIHISNIRASGSLIRATNGRSNGIVPMLQVYNNVARYIDQGGKRPGSFAMYLEPWHADVFEFLDLRKNTGSETDRARDLFLALWVPDNFIRCVLEDKEWYLMCPDECPNLNDNYGDKYEELYNKYISDGKYIKKVMARKLWNKILESQVETGNPYILYKDHINKKSNQKNIGVIKSSNLCAEIVEYSDDKETAVCNLVSIALPQFIIEPEFNYNVKIYSMSNCVYCNLSKMILNNYNIKYEDVNLDDEQKRKNYFNELNNNEFPYKVNTLPQIYLDEKRIGGYDKLKSYLEPKYDFNKLKNVSKIACKNLNKVIDVNYYPTKETKLSNFKHRPIGIGVQGLADVYFKMRYSFESNEAKELNKRIFETIYYGALEMSMELAKEREENIIEILNNNDDILNSELAYKADDTYEHFKKDINRPYAKGSYHTFIGSPLSEGKLQFDLWDVKPSDNWDWDKLRDNIIKYGVRNSLLIALMPTASTSQILGNNESFEPMTNNIYLRRTQAGEFKLINKFLINDLKNLGLWNNRLKEELIYYNGSVQNLNIPDELKELYKTNWEIKQKIIIEQASDRAPFVDQTQSMNIYIQDANFNKISSSHILAWNKGLKTGIYYFRTRPAADAIKFTIDKSKFNNECLTCSA